MSARSLGRLVLAVLMVVLVFHLVSQAVDPGDEADYHSWFREMAKVIEEVQDHYVDEPDSDKLFEGAIKGMLRELDPYSAYIPENMYHIFKEDTQGSFGGLGIIISMENDELTVIAPQDANTPAAQAGILPGDKIIKIEGESTEGISLLEAVNKLRGKPGTKVTITVRHRGSPEEVDVTITREVIQIHSVKGYRPKPDGDGWDYWVSPEEKIAYVRLTAFQENTAPELDEAMKEILAGNPRGMVLDLRGNPGGLLGSAIEVSDRFLVEGVIVSIRGRKVRPQEKRAHKGNDYPKDLLLVVLVNQYSASASEIVAGALQDHARATLIGEETFGKGSVQEVLRMPNGSGAIKLTTAKYYTPSGRTFSRDPKTGKGGLVPDIKVPYTLEQNRQLFRQWRELVVPRDSTQEKENSTEDEEPFVDTQLQRAVDLLVGLNVARAALR